MQLSSSKFSSQPEEQIPRQKSTSPLVIPYASRPDKSQCVHSRRNNSRYPRRKKQGIPCPRISQVKNGLFNEAHCGSAAGCQSAKIRYVHIVFSYPHSVCAIRAQRVERRRLRPRADRTEDKVRNYREHSRREVQRAVDPSPTGSQPLSSVSSRVQSAHNAWPKNRSRG